MTLKLCTSTIQYSANNLRYSERVKVSILDLITGRSFHVSVYNNPPTFPLLQSFPFTGFNLRHTLVLVVRFAQKYFKISSTLKK